MCDTNIADVNYAHGGKLVQTTRNIEKTTRTAREIAQVQRDSYEALAENFAAAQRRTIGLDRGGLEFRRLQEQNARAAQEWFANGVRLIELQQRNAEFVQGWTGEAVEALREQAEHNVKTAEAFARSVNKQQEGFRALTQQWVGTYRDFFSPFSYTQEGLKTVQRATQQVLEVTEESAQQGLRVAEEATEQTDKVLRQTEKVAREAELRTAVFGALKTTDYDGLTVEEISKRLDGLSAEELKEVRQYEKRNKNRESLIERIDRKIRANS
jgi:transglutaminase/protease-like cytokinesis protein 3